MKTTLFVLSLFHVSFLGFGQPVPSSCTAPVNIIAAYQNDADRLSVRHVTDSQLILHDSFEISGLHSDTFLNALVAVYNAPLPASDTVYNLNIHSHQPALKKLSIAADSNAFWMKVLKNGDTITGHPTIDSLFSHFDFSLDRYFDFNGALSFHSVSLVSSRNLNLIKLSSRLNAVSGVYYSYPDNAIVHSQDVIGTIRDTHVELIYYHGWGDCMSGCIYKRYWVFKIFYDCSVEFVESYGSPLYTQTGIDSIDPDQLQIYPNPPAGVLTISWPNSSYHLILWNMSGLPCMSSSASNNVTLSMDGLPKGFYLLEVWNSNARKILKLLKD